MQVISFVSYKEKNVLKEKEAKKILGSFAHLYSLLEEYQDAKVYLLRYFSDAPAEYWKEEKEKLFDLCAEYLCDVSIVEEVVLRNKPKLFVTDMDSTLIQEEIIDEIADFLSIKKKITAITEEAMSGKMDFSESLQKRVQLLKGVSRGQLKKILTQVHLNPCADKLISTLKRNNIKTALVSGGFEFFTLHFQKQLGFDYQFANELQMEKNKIQGGIKGTIIDQKQKKEIVKKLCQENFVKKEELIVIGDGANDREMLALAALGIAYYPKPALLEEAFSVIRFGDLSTVLYFSGLF